MDNNFGWNLGGDFIAHYGTKRHSGRYPWGSGAKNGKTPIHEHGEKKHKGESHHTPLSPENQRIFNRAKREDKWSLEFLEKTQNLEGITRKQLLSEYAKYLKDPKSYKAPADDYYDRKNNPDDYNSRSSNSDIENKVAQARKTGKYDMEFLEQNGDLDDNGDLLTGKELDDSYRKWLEKNSNRHVSHSGLDSDNIVRILNTPI